MRAERPKLEAAVLRLALVDRAGRHMETSIRCPSCKRPVGAESPSFPFCSERCRWVDLAHWLEGTYRIEAALSEESAEDSLPQERAEEPDE